MALLWAWGANSHGQLGTGDIEDRLIPHPVAGVPLFSTLACGGGHSIGISEGRVWSWGENGDGELCQGGGSQRVPSLVEGVEGVTGGACGWSHSLLLFASGTLRSAGSNSHHQLLSPSPPSTSHSSASIPSESDCSFPLERFLTERRVVKVVCGLRFTVVATAEGEGWGWGENRHGQLGVLGEVVKNPTQTPFSHVTDVAAGQRHTLWVCGSRIFSCGEGRHGQLGKGTMVTRSRDPVEVTVEGMEGGGRVFCSWSSSFILSPSGVLFAFGRNHLGQLGLGNRVNQFTPCHVTIPTVQPLSLLACGSEHSIALCGSQGAQEVWVWGWGEHGQTGVGSTEDQLLPTLLRSLLNKNIQTVACGSGHSLAVEKL